MSKKIGILGVLIVLIGGGITFAIDTISEGFQVDVGTPKLINAFSTCRIVSSPGSKIFVPTKTSSEWTTFLSNSMPYVAGLTLSACTRTYSCTSPAQTAGTWVWNNVSSYTQSSLDGIIRTPSDDATTEYNTTVDASSCRFTCAGGYTRDGSNCINARTYYCNSPVGQTAGSWVRNSVDRYAQSWIGSWSPVDDATTEYNTTADSTSCRFKCAGGYVWDGTTCQLIVNGSCGTANGAQTYSYPVSNHCNAGTKQDVDTTAADNIYDWNCNGAYGGSNIACTAPRRRDGVCNNAVALGCSIGSWKTDNGATSCSTTRTWYCGGINGGLDSAQCSLANATCPVCGGSSNTCSTGSPSGYSAGSCGGNQSWTCTNGGYTTSCSLANAACPTCGGSSNTCNTGSPSGYSAGSCGGSQTWTCNNGGYTQGCSIGNAACPTCGGSSNTCSLGSPSGYSDGGCSSSKTWTCSNGGYTQGCSIGNASCPSCNNTVALGCSVGSYTSDGGQTACNTTRTWYCSNGGYTSSQCSKANASCPTCGGSANTCSLGSPSGYSAGSCGGSQTWTCSNGGFNQGCSIGNAACPTCGGSANTCSLGSPNSYADYGCSSVKQRYCTNGGYNQLCQIANASCPSCGGSANTCSLGSPSGYSAGSCGGSQTWTCSNGGYSQGCGIGNPSCPSCGGSANTCSIGSPSGYSDGGCGSSKSWTCINGGYGQGCSIGNASCPSCNNSVALGCSVGSSTSDNGQTSCGTTRTWYCSNGGYTSSQCSKSNSACASCSSPCGTIAHNATCTAYSTSSVSCGSSCSSETRTCNNGTLGGSYSYGSCSATCANCSAGSNGGFSYPAINHGSNSPTVSKSGSGPRGSNTCTVTFNCRNGSASKNGDESCSFSCSSDYTLNTHGTSYTRDDSCDPNPACGSANGGSYNDPPGRSGSLCSRGSATNDTTYSTYWSRRCDVAGTYVNCSANRTPQVYSCKGTYTTYSRWLNRSELDYDTANQCGPQSCLENYYESPSSSLSLPGYSPTYAGQTAGTTTIWRGGTCSDYCNPCGYGYCHDVSLGSNIWRESSAGGTASCAGLSQTTCQSTSGCSRST